jgi:hypothetical protein
LTDRSRRGVRSFRRTAWIAHYNHPELASSAPTIQAPSASCPCPARYSMHDLLSRPD